MDEWMDGVSFWGADPWDTGSECLWSLPATLVEFGFRNSVLLNAQGADIDRRSTDQARHRHLGTDMASRTSP